MKKSLIYILIILLLPVITISQEPLKIVNGKSFYYKNTSGGLITSLTVSEVSMKDCDPTNLKFNMDVPTDQSNTTNIHFVVKTNHFKAYSSSELGLIDSAGIRFEGYRWDAIYISEMDKFLLYWTDQHSGDLKPEHISIKFVLGTDKEEMKKYRLDEAKAKNFIVEYQSKLDQMIPLLKEKKEQEEKRNKEEKIKKRFEEELAASKDRQLFDWAFEKGSFLKECKKLWFDGEVLNTWKSQNLPRWEVVKDEYAMPLYKKHYILMLIKSEDGYCYLVHNTLRMDYEGGGNYGEMYLWHQRPYYNAESNQNLLLMIQCGNIK